MHMRSLSIHGAHPWSEREGTGLDDHWPGAHGDASGETLSADALCPLQLCKEEVPTALFSDADSSYKRNYLLLYISRRT